MCKIFCNFAPAIERTRLFMETLLKNLGIIILLLGVVCLVIYKFACPSNALLILSIVLEIAGIISYIVINRRRD